MVPFGKNYFYHDGKIYKEIKPSRARSVPRYNLQSKSGKRQWLTIKQIESLLQKHHRM